MKSSFYLNIRLVQSSVTNPCRRQLSVVRRQHSLGSIDGSGQQKRIGGFSIFHFTKIYSGYCFYVNQTTFSSFPVGLKLRNFTFRFLVPGVPLSYRKEIFVLNFTLLYLFR